MKKTKIGLSMLLATSLIAMSGCSLFDDSDLEYTNTYNVPTTLPTSEQTGENAGGVYASENENTPNSYCFKSIPYGTNDKIKNNYAEGEEFENEFNVNDNKDYPASKSNNNYDLYIPKGINKNEKHVVMLFIHGGAWIGGFKTDVNPYVYQFANEGYITATIKYTLLKKSMDDPSLSLFRDLDEIDACIASIKSVLAEKGFDTTKTKLVIGGASSGAHLTMLYSYSRGDKCPLPIEFLINAVGPTDIKAPIWKYYQRTVGDEAAYEEFISHELDATSIADAETAGKLQSLKVADDDTGEAYYWNDYQTMRIANGMCGLPHTTDEVATSSSDKDAIDNPNSASNLMTKVNGGEDQISVTYWINKGVNKFPMICAYGGRDGVVGIKQYSNLRTALDANSISCDYYFFKNSDHNDINEEVGGEVYTNFINAIKTKASAI